MKKNIFIYFILLLLPLVTFAQGGGLDYPYRFYDLEQHGIIYYENGKETLVLSMIFEGDENDFGWLIPTPTKPHIEKVSIQLFTSLEDLTQLESATPESLGEKMKSSLETTRQIDIYEIVTIYPESTEKFTEWLGANGYTFPVESTSPLNQYIQNHFYITLVKIKPNFKSESAFQKLQQGHTIPLKFVFNSDEPIYPIKLSRFKLPLQTGRVGDAIKLKPSKYSWSHPIWQPLSKKILEKGTVAFWVFADENFINSEEVIPLVGLSGQFRVSYSPLKPLAPLENDIVLIYKLRGGPQINFSYRGIYSFTNGDDFVMPTWGVSIPWKKNDWNFIVITWETGKIPQFFHDGKEIPYKGGETSPIPNPVVFSPEGYYDLRLDIGGYRKSEAFLPSYGIALDELTLYNRAVSSVEISSWFDNPIRASESADFVAHFDGIGYSKFDIEYTVLNQSGRIKENIFNEFFEFDTKTLPPSLEPPDNVNLIFYIISKNKTTLSNFTTEWAGRILQKKAHEILPTVVGEERGILSKIFPKKYFLTKLSRQILRSFIDEDFVFRNADNNVFVNAPPEKFNVVPYIFVGTITLIVIGIITATVLLLRRSRKKRFGNETLKNQSEKHLD